MARARRHPGTVGCQTRRAGADRSRKGTRRRRATPWPPSCPSFSERCRFLHGPYRSGEPAGVGLSQYPGGHEYYQHLIELYTTLTITPEKLHALGLSEVERLNTQLDGIRREVRFSGTLAEFKHYLATAPQFFPRTTVQFGERLEVYVGRSAAAAPRSLRICRPPRTASRRCHARSPVRKPLDITTSRRRRSRTVVSLQRLASGTHVDVTAGALICHELIPGHHFQIALQQENTALPNVRRYDFSETGFVEGWASTHRSFVGR